MEYDSRILFISLIFLTFTYPDVNYKSDLEPVTITANRIHKVTATVYHAVSRQTDSTPLITADGSKINPIKPQRWCAISKDLEKYFSMGDTIVISGTKNMDGIWIIHDRMHYRWKNKIDLLVKSNYLNKWDSIKIYKL